MELEPLPMREALAFWRAKVPMSSREFQALAEGAKARAFAVSGLARSDMLGQVFESLCQALERGDSFATWKKGLGGLWEELGWTGHKAWRLDTIFRTNVQSAYQAGRYAQMLRVAEARPWWRYDAVNDSRTRPTHRALSGKIFRFDHPFWARWYPPNGYRCRCSVSSLSDAELQAQGLSPETKDPTGELIEPLGPNSMPMPARPLLPDAGFGTNVGRDWLGSLTPTEFDGEVRFLGLKALCREGRGLFAEGDPCKPPLADLDPRHVRPVLPGEILPKGLAPEEYVRAFLDEFGIGDIEESRAIRLPAVELPMVVGKGFFVDKATGGWKTTWTDKGPYMRLLARTIQDPFEIWQTPVELPSGTTMSLRMIRLFKTQDQRIGGYGAFHLIGGRFWRAATAFAPKAERSQKAILEYLERYREGVLLFREELK